MIEKIDIGLVLNLYKKYIDDLKRVRAYQKKLYSNNCVLQFSFKNGVQKINKINPQLDDIEAEITYLLIRESKPQNVVEISPGYGWSTSWILHAIRDNGFGQLYSFDLIDKASKNVPRDLSDGVWHFFQGDIKKNMDKLPEKIDYLFIDSDHSAGFTFWYINNLFPRVKNIPVSVHDIFHESFPNTFGGECVVITNWLKIKRIDLFTVAPTVKKDLYDRVVSLKNELNIGDLVHYFQCNTLIFFIL